jgi:DnaK suppressor protein
LSPAELDELRRSLETIRVEIEELLDISREGAAPVALDTSIGRLTRVDALQQQSMAQANIRASEVRLRQVVAAQGRLERGAYGECLGCGEPIAIARLRVRPEATLCLECQDARERRA